MEFTKANNPEDKPSSPVHYHDGVPCHHHHHHEPKVQPKVNPHSRLGRNDPCHCGSGKKYKKCCLA